MEPVSVSGQNIFKESSFYSKLRAIQESVVRDVLESRLEDFRRMRSSDAETLFGELCFCILTANTSAEMGIRTQMGIGIEGFLKLPEKRLRDRLHELQYRFYNVRSRFIVKARPFIDELPGLVRSTDPMEAREFLVKNVDGISYKEASHFLRNVGVFDLAILDKHIVRIMNQLDPSIDMKVTPAFRYIQKENIFKTYSDSLGMKPGELDLYLWYIATGKIIK